MPTCRHCKNVLEAKLGVIRSIFLLLFVASFEITSMLTAQRTLRISNDLYGSHFLSTNQLTKGFCILFGPPPSSFPADILEAQDTISTKHKRALILKIKPKKDIALDIGDLVDVYVSLKGRKCSTWSSPISIVAFDRDAWTSLVPSSPGCTMNATNEDVRFSDGDE